MLRQTNLLLNGGNPLRVTISHAFENKRNCDPTNYPTHKTIVSRQKCRDLRDTKDKAIGQIPEIAWFQPLAQGLHSL
jgi:hypothetical protein